MGDFKSKEIEVITLVFFDKNTSLILLSSFFMIISAIWQPSIISFVKLFLILVASIVYVTVTLLFIKRIKDFTYLSWLVSLPLVVYCSALSVNNADLSEMEKNANCIAYFSAYFFFIALFYRVLNWLFDLNVARQQQ